MTKPRILRAFGESKPFADWLADPRCVVTSPYTLQARLDRGWTAERALTQAVHKPTPLGRVKRQPKKYRGVSYDKHSGCWVARAKREGKQVHLGRFVDQDEAARHYNWYVHSLNDGRELNDVTPKFPEESK